MCSTAKEPSKETSEDYKLSALRDMGWDIDAEIPMANIENLAILKEMEKMAVTKFELQQKVIALDERNKAMQRHKRSIEIALQQNTTLYNSMKSDLLKEAHNYQLMLLEVNKLKEDLRKNQKEIDETTKLSEQAEGKIEQKKIDIDKLTESIKDDKTTLVEWKEAMEDGYKGYQLIEQYYKEDQKRARELNVKRQQLQSEIDVRRKKIAELYDDQNTLEKNLERTASLYRAAHVDRRQMIETWKQAVNQMTQRELAIQKGEGECLDLSDEVNKTTNLYKMHDTQLNQIRENNRQVELAIELLNEETSGIKEQITRITEASYLKDREIEGLRKELENLSNAVQLKRLENRKMLTERDSKKVEIEKFEDVLKAVMERLQAMENSSLDATQRLQILEEMTDNEEKLGRDQDKEQVRVNDAIYRSQRQVIELQDEIKTMSVSADALRSTVAAMKRSARGVEKELKRQNEIYYDMSFKYLEGERKLATMRGTLNDPVIEARNQQILADLEIVYVQVQRRLASTEQQNKKLNQSMNTLVNVYNNDNKDLEVVKFKIKEAQVYCEGSVKRLKETHSENSELIVELSLMKMRCDDSENLLHSFLTGSFNLNQHRLVFKRNVKDRMIELKGQEDLLNLKKKSQNEELSTLRADIGERKKRIDALKARFELTSRLLGTNDDGTLVTSTQLKVRHAQERQLLAEEGDALNKKVLKAEQEVVALENTLRQFDRSNDNYRKSLKGEEAKESEKIQKELKETQESFCKDIEKLRMLRCKEQLRSQQMAKKKEEEESLLKKLENARQRRAENQEILLKLQKELDAQDSKLDRAEREIRQALKEIKNRPISEDFLELFNRDLELKTLEDRNAKAVNMLTDMATSDEDGPQIIHYMLRKGLKLPQHIKRTRSCISWKSASSSSDVISYISSDKDVSARSSSSDLSSLKDGASSSHISVVSLDFPTEK